MKKQILFMMFLSLAFVFAGVNEVFAQPPVEPNTQDLNYLTGSVDCLPAVPLTCFEDDTPLNPIPGKTYTYGIKDGTETTVASVQWFVYNATIAANGGNGPTIIVDGDISVAHGLREIAGSSDFLLTAEGHYGAMIAIDADDGSGNPINPMEIDISWQSFDGLTNEILLVAYVLGADNCSDNIEVYRIQPAFNFTLDIASIMPDGTYNTADGDTISAEECVDPVWSATYTPGATIDADRLTMDYGANYVFFIVSAANFVHSWQPTFSASHSGDSEVTEIAWAYAADALSGDATGWNFATGVTDATADPIEATDDAVGADGECIVVRVLVEHNEVENGAESTVTLEVDGIMFDAAVTEGSAYINDDLRDMDEPETGTTCVNNITDSADYILTPRPNIQTDTEPGATTPEPFIEKN